MTLRQTLSTLSFNSSLSNFQLKEVQIRVRMKGESPEAHADAILTYFGFSKVNEETFKARYGYDLRQSLIDNYSKNDNRSAHTSVGKGYFEVIIPLAQSLVAQIESVKNPIASNLLNANGNSNFNVFELSHPTTVPKNATPAEREFYRELDLLKTQAMNFGSSMVQDAEVRADYLKTIKMASDEFVEMAKSGQISYEEAAIRASKLRNYILEVSRGKNSDLGRAIAEFLKKEGPTFEDLLEKYSKNKFQKTLSALSQAEKESVYFEVVLEDCVMKPFSVKTIPVSAGK